MALANLVATWSKDRSRQIGAVIVDDDQAVVAIGWNGFPRRVYDDIDERHERPAKYMYSAHAERNALDNAARQGNSPRGCRLYCTMYPCADCARGIIQTGIKHVICPTPDWDDAKYSDDFAATTEMFAEAGVLTHFVAGSSPTRKPDHHDCTH